MKLALNGASPENAFQGYLKEKNFARYHTEITLLLPDLLIIPKQKFITIESLLEIKLYTTLPCPNCASKKIRSNW